MASEQGKAFRQVAGLGARWVGPVKVSDLGVQGFLLQLHLYQVA